MPRLDVAKERANTPGCASVMHFNNAGSSLPTRQVLDTLVGHLELEARIGGYEAADEATPALQRVYASFAGLLNCGQDEIALIENATRAWDMLFYSMRFQPGDRILTGAAEYGSNYIAFLQAAKAQGAEIVVAPNDETGQISIEAVSKLADERVKLIAITHVPTNGGLVNPAAAIGQVARERGILYLLDACQSVGQMPIDVQTIGCDMLTGTSRKYLRGPRGAGFLYVRKAVAQSLMPPFLDVHAATWTDTDTFEVLPNAKRFENWESYVAGRLALGAAVDHALALGLDAIFSRIVKLADLLRARLNALGGVTVTDIGREKCGIVTFVMDGRTADSVKKRLTESGINTSVSRRPSTRIDMTDRGLEEVVRASVHYYNTEEEIDEMARVLTALRDR